ncbi:hypothetical protein RUE5091_03666 [Ruegeria denitrificans]|uniref:Glycerophosphoryl diester phosphodiesterase membrane domain-containing protein n=1 Tax=Ruegeria denitrificans TaxID=1715692 RepID=A0A0P1IHQ7_9RHOB|nr:hypothetical protein [Ruegeria denitrificans]CUK13642.1 hypothetical protein RUE5091_03666 [Ruegeria denitrificans]
MLGWQIFLHSVRMVFGNLKQVLQITVGPALIATIVIVGVFLALGIPLEALDDNAGELPPGVTAGSAFVFVVVLIAVMFVTMFWIAVSWHRFILLEEYPTGILPTFRFDRILAYFGRVLLLGILMMIAYIPMGLVAAVLGESLALLSIILVIVYTVFLVICFYRLSIILPAAAIGSPISLGDAWNNTTGIGGAILLLLLVAFLFQVLVQIAFTVLAIIPVLGVLLTVFFSTLILPMINVSILTTMYGVFIEKRALS